MDTLLFRTQIHKPEALTSINHQHNIMMLGSCFAENIAKKMKAKKFNILLNPYGVIFNPASIAQGINFLLSKNKFTTEDLTHTPDEYLSFYHHSYFSAPNKEECLHKINSRFLQAKDFLKTADYIIITLGSSIAYRLKSTNNIVANCHKYPANSFEKIHLSANESQELLSNSIATLKKTNPHIQIIFTLSPVRYIKNDFTENSLSKANLRIAIQQIQHQFSNAYYFPAFEIMIDDLRDYRYYNQDLIHPSPLAIDYIWKYFKQSYFDKNTLTLNAKINEINQAFQHRLKQPHSEKTKLFKNNILHKIITLNEAHPHLDFQNEKSYFSD